MTKSRLPLLALGICLGLAACARPDLAPAGAAATGRPALDLIIHGGPILTMAADTPAYVEAVTVSGGHIVFAGADAAAMQTRDSHTIVKDLGGRTMLPGFYDAHGHVVMGGLQALSANLLPPPDGQGSDIAAIQRLLRDWAAKNGDVVKKANVIIGFGYDNAQLKEVRHPTRQDLDAVSTDVPVVIIHQSGHLAATNTAGLKLLGFDASTPNPAGGVIQREADGKTPNGVLEETAFFALMGKVIPGFGPEGIATFAREGAKLWSTFGYTTAEEGRAQPEIADIMKKVASEGGFKIDVVAYPDVLLSRDYILKNVSQSYVNRFRIAGAKITIDGSPQGFTAWRDRPYYNPVGNYPKGYAGYAAATPEEVRSAIDWAYANNIQILTHANGEKAGDLLIEALAAAEAAHGKGDRRPVLIHGQFERFDQVAKYKALGVFPSLFPMHTFYWGDWHHDHTVGPELAQNISPTGWYRNAGMIFSTHHDAPVALPDSMRVLDATVTRRTRSGRVLGPDQRVDTYTALRAMTIWPAYGHFEDKTKGSIEPGKLADFVVLSADPLKTPPTSLAGLKVVETIKEGATVYTAK